MERQLASIQKINKIEPIDGADAIEKAGVLGWNVVVKKGEFKVGDEVVYFEIDSVLPPCEDYAFLQKYNWRIKSIKLRGVLSQGLVLPLSVLAGKRYLNITRPNPVYDLHEGKDVSEMLGVTKFEPPIPANLRGSVKGHFPSFLHKTDTERIQSQPRILNEFLGAKIIGHEKVDGSSCTVYHYNGEKGVCSRNLDLSEDANNSFWQVVLRYDLHNKLAALGNYAAQAELLGPGVQKNKYALKEHDLYLFDIFDIDNQKYLNTAQGKKIAEELGMKWVPFVCEMEIGSDTTVENLLALAEGKSQLNPAQEREGIVFRASEESATSKGERMAFKVISNKFLLKNED
jgi:RNA ligase (TIGR02306 family)